MIAIMKLLQIYTLMVASCMVAADVLYLPSSNPGDSHNIKASADLTNTEAVSQISACLWIKSFSTNHTGTIFTINKRGSPSIVMGLVQFKGTSESDLETYIIVNDQRAPKPIKLEINDIRWHQVCVTWSNLEGRWRVFLDGQIVEHGRAFMVGEVLSGEMQINFGGLNTRGHVVQFNGKISDAFVWDRPLSPTYVKKIYNCKDNIRHSIASSLRGENKEMNSQSWTGQAHIYSWQPNEIFTSSQVEIRPNEPLCNPNVVIQCTSSKMLVSIRKNILDGLKVKSEDIHLEDSSCRPHVLGRNDGSIVFIVDDLNSCGTKREITETEVVYSNIVSNTPTLPFSLFIGQLFKMNIQCRYPVDIRVTMSSSPDTPLIGKTSLQDGDGLEAVSMLFEDDTFAQVHDKSTISTDEDKLYVGIALKSDPEDEFKPELKMVTDECWFATERENIKLFKEQGCAFDQDGSLITLIENGAREQTRFEVSTKLLPANTATYLHCAIKSCKGQECQRNCNEDSTTDRNKRDIEKAKKSSYSYISLGPIYRNTTTSSLNHRYANNEAKQQNYTTKEDQFPLYLVLIVAGLIVIAAITCSLLLYCLCRRHRTISHGKDSLNSQSGNGKLRPRSASIGSLGNITLSSSFPSTLSIDLYGDDTSCSSLESNYYYYVNT